MPHLDASSVSADEARALVLAQHEMLRSLLRATGSVAELAITGNRRVADLLPHYLDNVCDALERHLLFEESLISPILAADPPLGPERLQQLREEHARQRVELTALAEGCAQGKLPMEQLAARLRTFIADLLADMAEEERHLLARDVLRDDLVSVDQDCG